MDETEKYQQRLQAIAEKRRVQEEQERAKREMENERLRLQQLKRKSLRDQWLMDGPASPSSPGPRSPLWGSQAQDIEQRIDQLQTESHRLAEKEEKLEQQMESGQAHAAVVVDAIAEKVQVGVLENGQRLEEVVPGLENSKTPLFEEAEIHADKGEQGEGKVTTHNASEEDRLPNGPLAVAPGDSAVTMTLLGFADGGPYKNPMTVKDDDDGGVIVMRAERVIITDEGEELAKEGLSAATFHRSESPMERKGEGAIPEESSEVAREAEGKVAVRTKADMVAEGGGSEAGGEGAEDEGAEEGREGAEEGREGAEEGREGGREGAEEGGAEGAEEGGAEGAEEGGAEGAEEGGAEGAEEGGAEGAEEGGAEGAEEGGAEGAEVGGGEGAEVGGGEGAEVGGGEGAEVGGGEGAEGGGREVEEGGEGAEGGGEGGAEGGGREVEEGGEGAEEGQAGDAEGGEDKEGETNGGEELEPRLAEGAPVSDLPSSAGALDGAVAAVPPHTETSPPRPDAEGEASDQPAEGKVKVEGTGVVELSAAPGSIPGEQFEEVSLAEPLLVPNKAQALAEQGQAATEPLTPTRGETEGGVGVPPKRKTCQCCSVM